MSVMDPTTARKRLGLDELLTGGGLALAGGAGAAAKNRGAEFDAQVANEQLRQSSQRNNMAASESANQEARAALKDLMMRKFLAGGAQGRPDVSPYYKPAPVDPHLQAIAGDPEVTERLRNRASFNYNPMAANPLDASPEAITEGRTYNPLQLKKASLWEKLAGIVGTGAQIAGAFI